MNHPTTYLNNTTIVDKLARLKAVVSTVGPNVAGVKSPFATMSVTNERRKWLFCSSARLHNVHLARTRTKGGRDEGRVYMKYKDGGGCASCGRRGMWSAG